MPRPNELILDVADIYHLGTRFIALVSLQEKETLDELVVWLEELKQEPLICTLDVKGVEYLIEIIKIHQQSEE